MRQQFEKHGEIVFQYGIDQDELNAVSKDAKVAENERSILKRTLKVSTNDLSEPKVFKRIIG